VGLIADALIAMIYLSSKMARLCPLSAELGYQNPFDVSEELVE
jgi:hypothetical protein